MSTTDETNQIIASSSAAYSAAADQLLQSDDDAQAPSRQKNAPLTPLKKGKPHHVDVMVLTTPQKLTAFLIVICTASICFGVSGWSSAGLMHHALTAVGMHGIPSSLCMQEIRADLAEMNTAAINEFLARTDAGREAAHTAYKQKEDTVTGLLVSAASDVTYGAEDMAEIKAILGQIHEYIGLIETARAYRRMHSEVAPQALIQASDHLQLVVVKLVDAMIDLRRMRLERLYKEEVLELNKYVQFTFASGLILLLALVGAQLYSKHKTRRLINPLLFVATASCIGVVIMSQLCMMREMESLNFAKNDVYGKMIVLWQVRSAANDANGLESLYLVGQDQAKNADAFQKRIDLINKDSANLRSANVFADDWASYIKIDREIRALETSGKHNQAIDLCLGADSDQSEWAFKKFNDEISVFLEKEKRSLQSTITSATDSLKWLDYAAVIVAICISCFAWLGLRARLKEYGW